MPRQLAGFTEVQVPRTPPSVDVALTFLGALFMKSLAHHTIVRYVAGVGLQFEAFCKFNKGVTSTKQKNTHTAVFSAQRRFTSIYRDRNNQWTPFCMDMVYRHSIGTSESHENTPLGS